MSTELEHARTVPWRSALLGALALVALPGSGRDLWSQSAEVLLEQAFYLEVARCDPQRAMAVYRKVLDFKPRSERAAALAHLRLGVCCRLLGDDERAQDHFRTVCESYAGEADVVKAARHYLRPQSPARFLPPEVLLYVELVNPAAQVGRLSELVKETPFQNPLDYTLSYLTAPADETTGEIAGENPDDGPREREPRRPEAVQRAAALLNKGFLNELRKIEGLAVAVPAGGDPDRDQLLVFLPGSSDVVRGLLTALLSVRQHANVVRSVPIYHFPPETAATRDTYLAFDGDVVLWGRPRQLVEEAVERYRGRGRSLAANAQFQRARSASSAGSVFSFSGKGWIDRLHLDSGVEAVGKALELDRIGALDATLTFLEPSDSLLLTLRTGLDGELPSRFWSQLKTPPLDRGLMRAVPPDCWGFLALRLEDASERWANLGAIVASLARSVPEGEQEGLRAGLRKLNALFATEATAQLLGHLRGVVLGTLSGRDWPSPLSWFAVLECDDPERGEELLRSALSDALERLLWRQTRAELQAGDLEVDGVSHTVHFLPLVPGIRLSYLRLGDLFVISLSPEALKKAIRAAARPAAILAQETAARVPHGARKVLFLRRELLVRLFARGDRRLQEILGHLDHALLYTREGEGSMSLELRVPALTRTGRAILNTMAGWLATPGEGS
jgi:hypothetical protein